MSTTRPTNAVCDRARTYASLQLDGELSQLEEAMLGAHLSRCEGCRGYAAEIAAVAGELRSASLERLERPISLPPRRRVSFGTLQAAAVAAVALAAVGIGGILASLDADSSGRFRIASASASRPAYLQSPEYELRQLQRWEGVPLTEGTKLVF